MLGLANVIMAIMNGAEVIIIVIIIAVLFLGAKKIPELARSFGRASTEYQKAKVESKREMQQTKNEGRTTVDREKLESIADTLGIDYSTKNDDELRSSIDAEINRSKNKN